MATLHHFRNSGLTFAVDDSGGDGDVVILLHGFPQTRRSWHLITPSLAELGYRVLAPDQRGYSTGARPTRRREYTLDRLSGDIVALADVAGAERFHVVGHDWGGAVAWELAERHGDRLASVTSLSTPHPQAMARAMVTSTQALHSWYMAVLQLPVLPEAFLSSRVGGERLHRSLVESGLSPEQATLSVKLLASGGARGGVNWYRALPLSAPRRPAPITVGALYVYGAADFALGRTAADLTERYVAGPYTYEVLEGVGHWIPDEAPEAVVELLTEHFAQHPVRGSLNLEAGG